MPCSCLFYLLSFSFILPRPPTSTLFPYTTLFRSLCWSNVKVARAGGERAAKIMEDTQQSLKQLYITYRSEEHTSELQSRGHLVCRLLLEKKNRRSQQHVRTKPYRYVERSESAHHA